MFSVKKAKYKGVISRLFDYDELAEFTFKLTVYSTLALYIALVTGLLTPGPTILPTLGILTLRAALAMLLLVISIYVVREFKVRTERRKATSQRDSRRRLYSLIALLSITVAFYALLLYY